MSLKTLDYLHSIKDNSQPLFFILGPCAMESESHSLKMAEFLKKLSEKLNFKLIFKSSFDKANRTSLSSYRSLGLEEGCRILSKVKKEFDVPTITDIHEPPQASIVAEHVDILQIPAFLCRQTDLLVAAAKTGKILNIKKGQFLAPEVMGEISKKVESADNDNIWFCERGYAFGYGNLIVDYRNFSIMKSFQKPVVFDATHSVQRPSSLGSSSGGDRKFVLDLAISAVAQGIAGIFMEVHEEPERAPCDGPNSIRLSQLEETIKYLLDLDSFIKSRKKIEVY